MLPVEQPFAVVVAGDQDTVPGAQPQLGAVVRGDHELGAGEQPSPGEAVPDGVVEGAHLVPGRGEDGHPGGVFRFGVLQVVGDHPVAQAVGVRGDVHPPVGQVGVQGAVDLAAAQLGERGLLPGLALAVVVPQLDAGPLGQRAEQPAGVDLGELGWITDQDDGRPGAVRVVEEPFQVPGADHPCLVDDQDVGVGQVAEPAPLVELQAGQQLGHRGRGDGGATSQAAGGQRGQRRAVRGAPGELPGQRGGGQPVGLARARGPDHHVQAPGAGDGPHHRGLVRA